MYVSDAFLHAHGDRDQTVFKAMKGEKELKVPAYESHPMLWLRMNICSLVHPDKTILQQVTEYVHVSSCYLL